MNIEIMNGTLLINNDEIPLQNHEVIKAISGGANARVFLTLNKLLDRYEALKIWHPRKGQVEVDEDRFYSEIRKNSQFSGVSSIATIYSGSHWKNFYYCLMEYCPGITLKEFLENNPSWWVWRWGIA